MASIKTNLTKSYIESLTASDSGARTYLYDTNILGLELCVQSTGSKSFSVRRWVNGKSHRVVLGRYDGLGRQPLEFDSDPFIVLGKNPGLTLDQARTLAQAVLGELSKGDTAKIIKE